MGDQATLAAIREMCQRQIITHNQLIGPHVPVLIQVSRVLNILDGGTDE